MVYRGNIVGQSSPIANSLETEGIIENCLLVTGDRSVWGGGGGGGGGEARGWNQVNIKYYHDTTKILQSTSPSPSPPRQ